MLCAYSDESYSGNIGTTPVYVVAGYLAAVERWEFFESLWRESMDELGISRIGIHASKCANGAGPYDGMRDHQRRELQHRLIVDIAASRLYGFVAIVDMDAYRKRVRLFNTFLGEDNRKYNVVHVLAVRQCVHMMCYLSESTDEEITFVLDRNKEFGARARQWYSADSKSKDIAYRHRLGSFAEGDRMKAIGLQAADLLAYSAYRNATDKPSWQWEELKKATKVAEYTSDEHFWQQVEDFIEEEQRARNDPAKVES